MFPSNPGNRRQYFYLPEGETSEVQSSADASCISREDLDSKGCQLHWADHCKYRNDRSGGGRNQFGFETIIYRRKSVFPDYCGSSMGTVSLRDMLADSFVDVLLSKDGDGPDLFTWDGSEFDSFDCLDNRIQMVDESVCNFAKLMCPVLQILPNGLPAVPESVMFTPQVLEKSVIVPGILLSMGLFALLTAMTARWYQRRMEVGWEK